MATIALLKSGNYRVQIRVRNLKHISGTFPTKQQADDYISMIESQIASIIDAENSKLPVDMTALYMTMHPDLKDAVQHLPVFTRLIGNIASHELTLSRLIDDFMYNYDKKDNNILNRLKWWSYHYGHISIKEISEDHIRHGINTLLAVGCAGKGVSPQTTNRYKANISSVFEFGKEKYHLKANPCRHIKAKPEGKGRKRYLTIAEQQKFLAAARCSRWDKFYLLVLIAITTGARRSELMCLRYNDIDWDNGVVICRDTKNGTDKKLMFTDAVKLELVKVRVDSDYLLFGNPRKPRIQYDFRKEWVIALNQAGIPEVDGSGERLVFHSLRHSFCSTLSNNGAELQEIAALAGHKSLQTTMRYTHSNNDRLAKVIRNTFSALS